MGKANAHESREQLYQGETQGKELDKKIAAALKSAKEDVLHNSPVRNEKGEVIDWITFVREGAKLLTEDEKRLIATL